MVFALEISILMRKMPKFSACGGLYSGKHHYFEESPPQAEKIGVYNYKNTGIYKNTLLIKQIFSKGGILNINTPDLN